MKSGSKSNFFGFNLGRLVITSNQTSIVPLLHTRAPDEEISGPI